MRINLIMILEPLIKRHCSGPFTPVTLPKINTVGDLSLKTQTHAHTRYLNRDRLNCLNLAQNNSMLRNVILRARAHLPNDLI